jgi:hypothetical protein
MVASLTPGTQYKFRLRARNTFGFGAYSNILTMIPAGPPSTPDPVTATIDNVYVRFSWAAPASNGAAISNYFLWILKIDGFSLAKSASCDTSVDPLIVTNRECLVPMSELTSSSQYGLL